MMEAILTIDLGSSSMRATLHDENGSALNICRRSTVPDYKSGGTRVELDADIFIASLLSLLKESQGYCRRKKISPLALSVTSQRSSVVPVDDRGKPLAPFIMWHDKRTVALCTELQQYEDYVYQISGLRISPVFSAVKMAWIRNEMLDVYAKTSKMLGIHDLALFTLCGTFITDHSLASNTNLLNLASRTWDPDLLDIFSVDKSHLCELVPPGSICGTTSAELCRQTGIAEGTPIVTAGGDQQCAALGLGVTSAGKLKCTTGTGSYLIAHVDVPVIDEKKRFFCRIGSIPGSYNLEAGMLTTGTVYRWFVEQFYASKSGEAQFETANREVLSSPPGANGLLLLPYFEGSGAPFWNPRDTGLFYGLKLSTKRADMARAVIEGIVLGMQENVSLFREKLGTISQIAISGGMTRFDAYNQLQADIFGSRVALYANRESTSIGAWISAAVACGLYDSYDAAFRSVQPEGSEKYFEPDKKINRFYNRLNLTRNRLYQAIQSVAAETIMPAADAG
ncbi:MAG: FGGY-family carbohydrate kinase [Desulfocapsaceae bacterium]|jgi:sugar (pentulose or hexulose) kinase|nr:FGGY-family carbohydrate kinase [Desulfocapsaceae bacterium]